jgi:methionyl aminopeptidase
MDKNFVEGMRKAGKLAAKVLAHTCAAAEAGVTTNQLDKIAHDFTIASGGTNACLGYKGYPKSICTSVNEVLCHGVPNDRPLKAGDIVNIDVTVKVGPYHGDTSRTIFISPCPNKLAHELVNAAGGAMYAGIQAVRPFGKTGDIGHATESWLKRHTDKFKVCRDIAGHGIGKVFHDFPFIPAYGTFGTGDLLKPWTCITVEPIILFESDDYKQYPITPLAGHDKCTVTEIKSPSGLSAQFEHTVLITDSGYEILTENY